MRPSTFSAIASRPKRDELSLRDARHVALAAQGFGAVPGRGAGRRALASVVDRLGCVQMDSVNVVVRSHYLPFFSRVGAYDVATLNDLLYGSCRALTEYWAHEASIVDFEHWSLLRWRMRRAGRGQGMWGNVARVGATQPELVQRVRARIAGEGPLAASDFENAAGRGSWWGWSDTKKALEYLFWTGAIVTRSRRASFERVYDLTERVIPASVLARDIDEATAQRELVLAAARALGVAAEPDLRDYFRLDLADARATIAGLVAEGRLAEIRVEGWKSVAYYVPPLRIPRHALGSTFLSPFDNLIWNRPRAARLFGFDFRLEIYVPAHKRVHGYYVLPYLRDGALAARVDLKFDRTAATLRAHAVHLEDGVLATAIGEPLRDDLTALATWLGAEKTIVPKMRDRR